MSIARVFTFALVAVMLLVPYYIVLPMAEPFLGNLLPGPPWDKLVALVEYLLFPTSLIVLVASGFGIWKDTTPVAYKLVAIAFSIATPPLLAGNMILVNCYLLARCI